MIRVEVAAALDAALGESPVWDVDGQVLHLVDILGRKIHQLDPARGTVTSMSVDGVPGAIALRRGGGYVAGIGLEFVTIGPDGVVRPIARASAGDRVNDGKCDARGRFVSGTMDGSQRRGAAALYQLQVDGTLTELLSDVTLSNGLDWNEAGDRLYYVDTTTERVDAFDYDVDSGRIGDRQPFADLRAAPGRPDGLTVDADGGVWVAVARAGVVHRYDRDGRLDAVIGFPTPIVTSCAFGGPDLRELYVTSSRALLPEAQRADDPVAGAVFVVEGLGVRGRPPHRYGGVLPAR
jgi:sugar lactone lactonase YvrE